MSDLLSIIRQDSNVTDLVQSRYGTAGLEALGLQFDNSAPAPASRVKTNKASKAAKATKSTKRAPQDLNVKPGDTFVHSGRNGDIKLVAVADGEGGVAFRTEDGNQYDSLTAAAKAVTGQKSINGRRFWTVPTS